jgi:protein ImuB
LWLAVHFSDLAMELLQRDAVIDGPCAIVDADRGVPRIIAVNEQAADSGIQTGMTLAAAWSLLPALDVHERDPECESNALYRLAVWAGQFTPNVSIDDQALLLEVRASLRLFGGITALRDVMSTRLSAFGLSFHLAVAPTPRAAKWLAGAGYEIFLDDKESLSAALGGLPLTLLGWDEALIKRLKGIGARYLRDLIRLPRDGFARRYGANTLRMLDQAIGIEPDIRVPVVPPQRFTAKRGIPYETVNLACLDHPVRQMLLELDGYLRSTQQGISRLQLRLHHREADDTVVAVGFAECTREHKRINDLVAQRLEAVKVPAPITGITLVAHELAALEGRSRTLFAEQSNDDFQLLIERLSTRLGAESVTGLCECADYRPEQAWKITTPGHRAPQSRRHRRPEWLYREPQPLSGNRLRNHHLKIIRGPERIETGWWDNGGISRDYYVAKESTGRFLWIYRDRRNKSWWIQGVFA